MHIGSLKEYLGNRSPVAIWREIEQLPLLRQHGHEFIEIAVILSGNGIHMTGHYQHRLSAGDVLIIHPGRTHGYKKTKNLNLINILIRPKTMTRIGRSLNHYPGYQTLFGPDILRRGQEYSEHLHLSPDELDRVVEWIDRLDEEFKRGTRAVHLLEEGCLALLIDLLCHGYASKRHIQPRPAFMHKSYPDALLRMGYILSWIEKNSHRSLRVADIASRARMSERGFYNVFKKTYGMTPHAYLIRVRIKHAEERLSNPEEHSSITEIATSSGFDDSNYFSQCFRRFAGMTPREYREKCRNM